MVLIDVRRPSRSTAGKRAGAGRARSPSLLAARGLPMPRLFLMDEPQPNTFATGRNPENAAVAVTIGLMRQLEPRGARRRDCP